MVTSLLHEKKLKEFISELSNKGFKVFDLERKSPDALAIKDNKVYAVEVLGSSYKKGKGWKKKWTRRNKNKVYHMFDGILIKEFRHPHSQGDRFVSDGEYKEFLSDSYKKENGKNN
jgi:hypothetical protein